MMAHAAWGGRFTVEEDNKKIAKAIIGSPSRGGIGHKGTYEPLQQQQKKKQRRRRGSGFGRHSGRPSRRNIDPPISGDGF